MAKKTSWEMTWETTTMISIKKVIKEPVVILTQEDFNKMMNHYPMISQEKKLRAANMIWDSEELISSISCLMLKNCMT